MIGEVVAGGQMERDTAAPHCTVALTFEAGPSGEHRVNAVGKITLGVKQFGIVCEARTVERALIKLSHAWGGLVANAIDGAGAEDADEAERLRRWRRLSVMNWEDEERERAAGARGK